MKVSIDTGAGSNITDLIDRFCTIILLTMFSVCGYAQTFDVKGEISASSEPVKYASVTYIDQLNTANQLTAITDTAGDYQLGLTTSVKGRENIPSKFELEQNYPNPFTQSTSVGYELSQRSGVSIRIYNVLGQLVKKFTFGEQTAGVHGIVWDGTNNLGERVPPGVYFYQMTAGKQIQGRKMLYGFGEKGGSSSFIQNAQFPDMEPGKIAGTMSVRDYWVEISNIDSTSPPVKSEQFSVSLSQHDTTLDFSVPIDSSLIRSLVTVTVTDSPGFVIPTDFAGVSFETASELPGHKGVPGYLFRPSNTQLVTLFKNTGIRNLRLGGSSVDGPHGANPSHGAIDSVFGFAKAVGIKIIYTLPLLDANDTADAATANYIWTHYADYLDCFSIGNEPNEPPYTQAAVGALPTYSDYLSVWRNFCATIVDSVPSAKFAGPDAGGWNYVTEFANDEKSSGLVVLITHHQYAGGKPYIDNGSVQLSVSQAIDSMLSPQWANEKYLPFYSRTVAHVNPYGLPCRMTEVDDYIGGVPGASNAMSSALWALDYMYWWAEHGLAGINFHNNQWLTTDIVHIGGLGEYLINPKAYAIRAFDLGSDGALEPVAITNSHALNLTAYAVRSDSDLCITVINREHGAAARSARVNISPSGFPTGDATAMFLVDPYNSATWTGPVTLGGDSITNNRPWNGKWSPVLRSNTGGYVVNVPASSAAIVKILLRQR